MGRVGRSRLLSSILLTFMFITSFLHDTTGTQTWTVGDSFGWNRSPPVSYDQWAAGKTIQVGDALLFSFNGGQHNVLEVTESSLASCIASDPISSSTGDPAIVQLTRAGNHGFISGLPGDCSDGMHLSLHVVPSSGPGATPTASPISAPGAPGTGGAPPPGGSASPTGGPSNSGAAPAPYSSLTPSGLPPGSPPNLLRPPAGTPVGSPPPGYAPNAAPNIPSGSPLSKNAPDSLPAPMAIVPGSPMESIPTPAPSPTGDVPAPSNPFSSPLTSPGSSPSPLSNQIPPQSSPMASVPRSIVGSPFGAHTSAATRLHRLDPAGLAVMVVAAVIFHHFCTIDHLIG